MTLNNKSLHIILLVFLFIFLFLSSLAYIKNFAKFHNEKYIDLSSNLVENVLHLAKTNLFNRRINPTGLFIYDFNLRTAKMPGKDHEVRQMTAIFALAELYDNQYLNEKEVLLLKDSINKIIKNSKTFNCENKVCRILSYHDNTQTGSIYLLYKSMLLIAKNDEDWFLDNKKVMKEFYNAILFSQKDDGDFTTYLHTSIDKSTINKTQGIGFAIGEAMSALALHLKLFPSDADAKESIVRAINFLNKRGLDNPYRGMYLWFMRAAYYIASNDILNDDFVSKFIQSARVYHENMFEKLYLTHSIYNTCPHTEGLAYYLLLSKKRAWPSIIEIDLYKKALSHNYFMQVREDNLNYILNRLNLKYDFLTHKYAMGAFLNSWQKDAGVRVDYVQHCIGAFLPYNNIIDKLSAY